MNLDFWRSCGLGSRPWNCFDKRLRIPHPKYSMLIGTHCYQKVFGWERLEALTILEETLLQIGSCQRFGIWIGLEHFPRSDFKLSIVRVCARDERTQIRPSLVSDIIKKHIFKIFLSMVMQPFVARRFLVETMDYYKTKMEWSDQIQISGLLTYLINWWLGMCSTVNYGNTIFFCLNIILSDDDSWNGPCLCDSTSSKPNESIFEFRSSCTQLRFWTSNFETIFARK